MAIEKKHKKIMTISVSHPKRAKSYGIYDGNMLVVTHIEPITGIFAMWEGKLKQEIQDRIEQGYIVLVDEPTDRISRNAIRIDFNETINGRSNFYRVLDAYFALSGSDSLVVADDLAKYQLKAGGEGSKIEQRNDEKGRITYNADWDNVTGGHRALLLQAYAVVHQPVDTNYIDAMFGALRKTTVELNPIDKFLKSMNEYDKKRAHEWEARLTERNK